jgi:DNA modification methylase
MINWKAETKPIQELKGWSINPRVITEEKLQELKQSLDDLGNFEPLVIDIDGTVIAGNQRLKIHQQLGDETVNVYIPDRKLTDKEIKKIGIVSNRHSGEWDMDLLDQEFQDVLTELGIDDLIPEEKAEVEEDGYTEPENLPNRIAYGEIYQLGEHRVMCGDATKETDVLKLLNGNLAQMTFTDPPYNIDYTGGTKEKLKIQNDKFEGNQFYEFLRDAMKNILNYTEGGIYVCMGNKELGTLKAAFEEAGGHWQDFLIWVKNTFTLSGADYQHIYESMLYGWREGVADHYFFPSRSNANVWEDIRDIKTSYEDNYTTIAFQGFQVRIKGKIEEGEVIRKKQKTNIWRYDKPTVSREHPTMKPINLCAEAIKNSSRQGQIVLDIFGGSGSTLMAAEKTKRICYMMELDEHYATVIIDRWEKLTGLEATKISNQEG